MRRGIDTHISRRFPRAVAAGMISACLLSTGVGAQTQSDAPPTPSQGYTAEGLVRSAEEAAQSVGKAIGSMLGDVAGMITPGAPTDHLPAQISDEDKQFFAVLEAIGLRLKNVNVSKGLLGGATYQFVAEKEPSDQDIAKAEALLRAYRDAATGLRSRARQKIARSALDTASTAEFALTSMDVSLTPWPDASYQISARPPQR